ncbi:hypothetical protein BDQ94DRAFT_114344 [Aspergillus welwitschiae]|uniref:Uncharacterized protein n=1 Tax=Aspergillus welwitschiae TaxID=1341132 RepID=A0A3F3QBG1_9EURO|nr:hypothetical protein BDQ94DRAFT_114344 [Aspergillus welwitschiae]RDH36533.1 hypothetical protein BDQ94DRAFT_114344 [Aspergillus welwitschiae]
MTDHQNRCNCPEQEAVTPSRSPQQPVILTLGSESLSGRLIGDASCDGRSKKEAMSQFQWSAFPR